MIYLIIIIFIFCYFVGYYTGYDHGKKDGYIVGRQRGIEATLNNLLGIKN